MFDASEFRVPNTFCYDWLGMHPCIKRYASHYVLFTKKYVVGFSFYFLESCKL